MSTSESTVYFVRSMGRIVGPFDLDRLRKLRARGQFGPGCEISIDRSQWRPWDAIDTSDPASAGRKSRAAEVRESGAASPATVAVGSPAEGDWHYSKNGQSLGPVSLSQLESLISSGAVTPSDLVWSQNLPDWQPLSEVAQFRRLRNVAALSAATASPGQIRYANFWKRLAAQIYDQTILGVITFGFAVLLTSYAIPAGATPQQTYVALSIGVLLIHWLYYAAMESSAMQGTFGKLAIELRVVDMQGRRIGFGRASGRFFGKILSGLMLGIGCLMIGMTPKRQGMHDMLTDCLVINHD